jgi:hypothetical protein
MSSKSILIRVSSVFIRGFIPVFVAARVLFAPASLHAQTPPPVLDRPAQLMLIRNTIALVNHGNLTGNYTVLRDLASENFRQRNTAGDLAATFANLRQQKLDLSPVLVIEPQFAEPREIAPGRLQLLGQFPTRPQSVQFMLIFQRVAAGWMIDEISLRVAPAESHPEPAIATRPPAPAATGYLPTPPPQPIRR